MLWFRLVLVGVLLLASVRVEARYRPDQPTGFLWGDARYIHWDERDHVWINTNLRHEGWVLADYRSAIANPRLRDALQNGERVPVKREIIITFRRNLYRRPDLYALPVAMAMVSSTGSRKRCVLINVEQAPNAHERAWPHLGVLSVGTVAHEEGWEVVIWDELIQGHASLEKLVQPGDLVGLSLVVTGMDRGVELARGAKALGAGYVIAGNDAAIFRSLQILQMPDKPIDAVFTSNSTNAVRQFLREIRTKDIRQIAIQGVATDAGHAEKHSNEPAVLQRELNQRKRQRRDQAYDELDGFVIPRLDLYSNEYWERIWEFYRNAYGHKHSDPASIRNATIHLAQGCTRTRGTDACTYCTIYGVGDVRIPDESYLARLVECYDTFGVNYLYNTTDSAFEMRPLAQRLRRIGFQTGGLILYGRAQGMATQPALFDEWQSLVSDRLLINCGMDSGDDQMLHHGVIKSSSGRGSRIHENRQAIQNLRVSGAHLHYALIFGSPGESVDSCERTMEFAQWSADTLGPQLDLLESDLYWLNFGSAASRIFRDHAYARKLAAIAGKEITVEDWYRDFGRHADALSVPWSAEEAWYRHFTHIDVETALSYRKRIFDLMARHPGHIAGREFAFKSVIET